MKNKLLFLVFLAGAAFNSYGQGGSSTGYFVANSGQLAKTNGAPATEVLFYGQGAGNTCFFQKDRLSFLLNKPDLTGGQTDTLYRVDMRFLNANPNPSVFGAGAVGKVNYHLENINLYGQPAYASVVYKGLYPGIWLRCLNTKNFSTFEYRLTPSAGSISPLQMQWQNASGVSLNAGNLVVSTPLGNVNYFAPGASQTINGVTQAVSASYVLVGTTVGLSLGSSTPPTMWT